MTNSTTPNITVTLVAGERVTIPAEDDTDVAVDVVEYVIDQLHCFIDKLREFLDEREAAAPITVMRAHVLLSLIDHEKRQWQQLIKS